jgi:hypothetical protein
LLDPHEQRTVDMIAEHGWFGIHVRADEEGPGFSYTTGWWESVQSPEAIIFGLNDELQHSMLWELFRQVKAGLRLDDGCRVSGLIDGFECIVRPVDPTWFPEFLGNALWYHHYRRGSLDGFKAVQIFWPGKVDRLFPWDSGCAPIVRDRQPQLYLGRDQSHA